MDEMICAIWGCLVAVISSTLLDPLLLPHYPAPSNIPLTESGIWRPSKSTKDSFVEPSRARQAQPRLQHPKRRCHGANAPAVSDLQVVLCRARKPLLIRDGMKAVKCATSPPPDSQHATTLATSDPLHTSWSKMIQTNPTRMSHGNDSSVLKQVSQNFAQGPMPGYNRAYLIVPVQLPPPLGVLKDTHLGFRENYLQLKQEPKSCFNFNMSRIKSSMVDSIGCILTILIHSATHLQVVLFSCQVWFVIPWQYQHSAIPPFPQQLSAQEVAKAAAEPVANHRGGDQVGAASCICFPTPRHKFRSCPRLSEIRLFDGQIKAL